MENIENKVTVSDPTTEAGTANTAAVKSVPAVKRNITGTIVGMGLLTAIVVVLQLLSSVIKFGPFSITLALTAIIVGGAIYGVWAGAWLGFAMGVTVLLSGDATAFMSISPLGTILIVLLKSTLAGAAAALVYKLIEKKNRFVSVVAAGIAAPVINTGIFIVGVLIFFLDTMKEWAAGTPVVEYVMLGLVGLNFPVELMVNLALSTVTVTIIGIVKKLMSER